MSYDFDHDKFEYITKIIEEAMECGDTVSVVIFDRNTNSAYHHTPDDYNFAQESEND